MTLNVVKGGFIENQLMAHSLLVPKELDVGFHSDDYAFGSTNTLIHFQTAIQHYYNQYMLNLMDVE